MNRIIMLSNALLKKNPNEFIRRETYLAQLYLGFTDCQVLKAKRLTFLFNIFEFLAK